AVTTARYKNPVADCTADARSPRSVAFTITAISAVDPTMPSAIQGASAPAVNNGLNAFDEPTPPNPPALTAIASTTTATSMIMVDRLIGARVRPRSVRYQCPSRSP